ncbi:hypothetical protein ACFVUW_01975 [Streptomyces xiamenensis]|uniref:hypothetical protein n=1 Tax=Streptomyces xiamenensis TaxID=408015 RepID=UPI0036E566C1
MDVSSDLYDPLFPSGSDVSVVTSFADLADLGLLAGHECLIEVDGKEVIRSGDSAFDDFDTVIAGQKLDVKESEFVPIDGEFEARIWPGVAVAKAPCTVSLTPGQNSMETYTIFLKSAYPKDDEESVEVLSQLIQPYMAAAIEGVPCAERDG